MRVKLGGDPQLGLFRSLSCQAHERRPIQSKIQTTGRTKSWYHGAPALRSYDPHVIACCVTPRSKRSAIALCRRLPGQVFSILLVPEGFVTRAPLSVKLSISSLCPSLSRSLHGCQSYGLIDSKDTRCWSGTTFNASVSPRTPALQGKWLSLNQILR